MHRHRVQAVDADAPARERADRPALAEVDADVAAAAPDHEVARMAVVASDAVVAPIGGVEGVGRPSAEAGDCRLWLCRSEYRTRPEQSKRRGPAAP